MLANSCFRDKKKRGEPKPSPTIFLSSCQRFNTTEITTFDNVHHEFKLTTPYRGFTTDAKCPIPPPALTSATWVNPSQVEEG
jgi:hypothetical protein